MPLIPDVPEQRASQAPHPVGPPADPRRSADPRHRSKRRIDSQVGMPRSHTPRRRPGGRAAALLAAAAIALGPLVTAPAALAQTPVDPELPVTAQASAQSQASAAVSTADDPTPTPSPTDTPLSGTADAYLAIGADGILTADHDLTATASLRNGTATDLPESTATLAIATTALTSRDAITDWLGISPDDGTRTPEPRATPADTKLTTLEDAKLPAVASGESSSTTIQVPAENKTLTGLKPGIYPVQVTVSHDGESSTATSVVTVPDPAQKKRTPVAVVVPITVGPLTEGLLTSQQLETLTAPGGELTAQLNAVAGTSAILAIDPAIPAAIRVLGSSAPETAQAWLDRLGTLPNERFALQFGDADIATQLQDGRRTLLAPTSLQAYMKAADFPSDDAAPTPTDDEAGPTPTPTATPTPGAPVFPTLADLQVLGENTRDAVYWPFSGTASETDVAALGTMSSGQTTSLTLLPSDSTSAGSAHAKVGDSNVAVYDSLISDALRAASLEEDPAVRGAWLSAVTAYLNLASRTGDGKPLLVAVDRSSTRDVQGMSAAVEAAIGAPGTTSTTLAGVLDSTAREVKVADTEASTTRVGALRTLLEQQQQITAFSSILNDPTLLTGPERASLLQLMGSGWLDDADAWAQARQEHSDATATTLDSVSIAPSSDFNLAGRAATRSFGIRNDLPWPVNVTLLTRPDNLRLEVQESTTIVAHAASTTAAAVPIRAQIGNGDVTLDLRLISPTGVPLGQPRQVVVTVHADWEIIGLSVLGTAIGLFLIVGVIRTVLSRRRKTKDAAAADGAPASEANPPAAPSAAGPPAASADVTTPVAADPVARDDTEASGATTPAPPSDEGAS